MTSRLSPLQEAILRLVGRLDPPPVVTGGAALVAFYTRHPTTRDVDAFWRDRRELGGLPRQVLDALAAAGLEAAVLQRTPAFVRLRIVGGDEVCLLDLSPISCFPSHSRCPFGSPSCQFAPSNRPIGTNLEPLDARPT